MATLIDERTEEQEADNIWEANKPENEGQLEAAQEESVEPQQGEDDLPEKYRGKSLKDLVQMHQEAEKAIGKHGAEVGELRKLVDTYIQAQLTEKATTKQDEPSEEPDWFADPDKALEHKLANHPKIKQAEQFGEEFKKTTALTRLQQDHPDLETIVRDERFVDWIKGSKVRSQLFVQADQQYDYDAANELLSTWKQLQSVGKDMADKDKETRKEKVNKASTGAARGSSTPTRKKVYRRSDIMRLREKDPERYNDLADEILLAYAEGRVV